MKKRNEVGRIIEKWRPKLFLGEWHFDVQHAKEADPTDAHDLDTLACVNADPVYKLAVITVYPAWYAKRPDVREHAIVHEMCHCLTEEVWRLAQRLQEGYAIHPNLVHEAVEKCTQRIANAVFYGGQKRKG